MGKYYKKRNNPVGRPIKWTEEASMQLAEELIAWLKASDDNIFFNRFLYEVKGLSHQTISDISEKHSKFSDAIKTAKKIQESKIVDMALKMKLNTTMSIFFLKCNAGWVDKQQIDVNNISPISINLDLGKDEPKSGDEL